MNWQGIPFEDDSITSACHCKNAVGSAGHPYFVYNTDPDFDGTYRCFGPFYDNYLNAEPATHAVSGYTHCDCATCPSPPSPPPPSPPPPLPPPPATCPLGYESAVYFIWGSSNPQPSQLNGLKRSDTNTHENLDGDTSLALCEDMVEADSTDTAVGFVFVDNWGSDLADLCVSVAYQTNRADLWSISSAYTDRPSSATTNSVLCIRGTYYRLQAHFRAEEGVSKGGNVVTIGTYNEAADSSDWACGNSQVHTGQLNNGMISTGTWRSLKQTHNSFWPTEIKNAQLVDVQLCYDREELNTKSHIPVIRGMRDGIDESVSQVKFLHTGADDPSAAPDFDMFGADEDVGTGWGRTVCVVSRYDGSPVLDPGSSYYGLDAQNQRIFSSYGLTDGNNVLVGHWGESSSNYHAGQIGVAFVNEWLGNVLNIDQASAEQHVVGTPSQSGYHSKYWSCTCVVVRESLPDGESAGAYSGTHTPSGSSTPAYARRYYIDGTTSTRDASWTEVRVASDYYGINWHQAGVAYDGENSDFRISDLAVWSRALTSEELGDFMSDYVLEERLGAVSGAPPSPPSAYYTYGFYGLGSYGAATGATATTGMTGGAAGEIVWATEGEAAEGSGEGSGDTGEEEVLAGQEASPGPEE